VVLVAACYALLLTWWRAPLDQAATTRIGQRFGFLLFDLVGLAPVGYALFAVALGVFAGVLVHKSQGAMAITLVAFLATRIVVEFLVRPRFLAPLRRTFPVVGNMALNEITGDWVLKAGIYSAQGRRLSGGVFSSYSQNVCGAPASDPSIRALRRRVRRPRRLQPGAVPSRGPVLAVPGHRDRRNYRALTERRRQRPPLTWPAGVVAGRPRRCGARPGAG
jgi:hypothetical protein